MTDNDTVGCGEVVSSYLSGTIRFVLIPFMGFSAHPSSFEQMQFLHKCKLEYFHPHVVRIVHKGHLVLLAFSPIF